MRHLIRQGESATVNSLTGTACPCMTYRGTGYSREWHRLNTGSANCNGTGLISSSTTTTTVKAIFYPPGAGGLGLALPEDLKTAIGEKIDADLVMYGQANTTDNAYFSISSFIEREDYITYGGVNYLVRNVYDLPNTGQVSLLKRKT